MNHAASEQAGSVQDLAEQSRRAFERDLPLLFQERPTQWIAYHGAQPLAFAVEKCLR